jgi:hypothetical protein
VLHCEECGFEDEAREDPDTCRECGANWKSLQVEHGAECPLARFEVAMQGALGGLVRRAFDMRNALKLGIQVRLEDLTVEEFRALQILEAETCRPSATSSQGSS